MLPQPDPMTGCPADHKSISTALLVGDGLEWRRCPYCGVMVEGALRTGAVVGPDWGPGRGTLTFRQQDRLTKYAGYVDALGLGR